MRKPLSPQDVTGLEFSMAAQAKRNSIEQNRFVNGTKKLDQSSISDVSSIYDSTNTSDRLFMPTEHSDTVSEERAEN